MPARKRTSVNKAEILSAIPGTRGIVFNLEKKLCCTRDVIKRAMQDPEIKKEMEDEAEREKDRIINQLMEDAVNGDRYARELYLKSQARDRGFGDKLEVSGANGQPLVFLHAVATDLIPNSQNGNASKQNRVSNWSTRAVEYHDAQVADASEKSVDELLAVKKRRKK